MRSGTLTQSIVLFFFSFILFLKGEETEKSLMLSYVDSFSKLLESTSPVTFFGT